MKYKFANYLCCACVLFSAALAIADDWPGFLGPNRDGVSYEYDIQTDFEGVQPKILWRKNLGEGFAAAAVVGKELFVLDRVDSLRDVLRCVDIETGKDKWTKSYEAPGKFSFNGSRTTPAVDENYVYTVGPMGELTCFDRKSHEISWQKNIIKDFDARRPRWATSQSPLLIDNMVIVAPQGKKASVVAYEKKTGKVIWQAKPLPGGMNYCSPALMDICGDSQIVMICGNKPANVIGVEPKSGKILWNYNGWACGNAIPNPVAMPGDRLFITGGYGAGSAIIQISKDSGSFTAAQEQRIAESGSQIANPLIFDGMVYANTNTNKAQTGLACFNETGEMMWNTGQVGPASFDRGNMLSVDSKLLILDSAGNLRIIQPDPYRYDELACIKLFDSGKHAWSPMAYADGKLYIRNQHELICVVLSAEAYK